MMAVSVLDSRVFRDLFGTQQMRDVFSDEAYVGRMIEVETALARAQSKVGVIEASAGDALTKAVGQVKIDYEKLSADTEIVGYPVLPLIQQLAAQTPAEVARYIHWGATTQDIMDCASQLQMRQGLAIVRAGLGDLAQTLRRLSERHRDTPMAGRTHLQHALPCTFGYKCAVYLSGIARHLERLGEIERRCLLVQFGGAAGTLASLGAASGDGVRVRAALAEELGLRDAPVTWHSVRDNVAEVLNFLALVGGSLGKIAYDMIVMSSSEVGEVSEPFVAHRGASSTMPQKRNPISSELVYAASKLLRSNAALGLDAMVVDFERASGPWHLEWAAIPSAFVLAAGSLHQTQFALNGLVVNTGRMMENLGSTRGLIVGEAVMMALAPHLGRQGAHDIVYEACKEAIESGKLLIDALKTRPQVMECFSQERLADVCNPTKYFGASQLMVDDMLRITGGLAKGVNGVNGGC
ncbi:uncharacterized protein E0L32_004033 [Thyridium curvatum]|uniref:Adenylosuccinate lyase C-terminal domain-containing protein n=1 Tax=Thyridium curvatum TaxID=1093900 RepID=A0A507BCJ1_9PEZI|nr:uncharacterized protein E0L32_004033 [Thyridium curvatum]TPX16384.1 hypothetical protein E0L32_004033 [Thyridium curvatum]